MITDKDPQRAPGLENVMARWRIDYIGKVLFTLGTVEAPHEASAIETAAKTFSVEPVRRNRIVVARLEERKRGDNRAWDR